MFDRLFEVNWASTSHAYGPADEVPGLLLALRSADEAEREKALRRFYSAVHHQGDVYPCTTASLPFLFELAEDAATPGRGKIVRLLVSIGRSAIERCDHEWDGPEEAIRYGPSGEQFTGLRAFAGAVMALRERAGVLVAFASDADPDVRRAAIPALGLFVADGNRAASVLRDRLAAGPGAMERLLVMDAMTTLALRQRQVRAGAMAWFAELAADLTADPETRLAAAIQLVRCAPRQVGKDAVPFAISMLREAAEAPAPDGETWDQALDSAAADPGHGAPPQVLAAFEHLDRVNRVHAPTTRLLRGFHEALEWRVAERTALLAEQLRCPHPGVRTDALRMTSELMESWRGDHASLIMAVARQLGSDSYEVSAEAAAVLGACHAIAGPAREALAAHVSAQRSAHGPDVWAAPRRQLRRAHQEAVLALADLGDARAVPSVLSAFDAGVDAWRGVQVAGTLPMAAHQLVPRLRDYLRRVDLAKQGSDMSATPVLSALAALGHQAALPVITGTLTAAVRHEQWEVTRMALAALRAFGPAADAALAQVRLLTRSSARHVRPAAVAALWAIGGDQEEVMPMLLDLLTGASDEAADVLGEIGPPAAAALPRLRGLLEHDYAWVRVHCAAAAWEIGGEAEAPAVLDALLEAWEENPATARHVVACLDRMGPAAAPALSKTILELSLPRRSGRFSSIRNDEELQRLCRAIVTRLA